MLGVLARMTYYRQRLWWPAGGAFQTFKLLLLFKEWGLSHSEKVRRFEMHPLPAV